MKLVHETLNGVKVLAPTVFSDDRGFFFESYNQSVFKGLGILDHFVQDNLSVSSKGTLRGLHRQLAPHAQAKLVSVLDGEVFDVAVDCREDSPTYKQWHAETLSAENQRMMYIPEGFAHGFYVLSERATFCYKCSDFYAPDTESSIRYDDASIGIDWPIMDGAAPVLSPKDAAAGLLKQG